MNCPIHHRVILALGVLLTTAGGCASSRPARFYILDSLSSPEEVKQSAAREQDIAIGIGPVVLPQYLDRPQIVTRAGPNMLQLAEFDRWAEPLKHNVSRVLAENLSFLLSGDRVVVFPWKRSTALDYRVSVEITRFDGQRSGEVLLKAHWTISGADGKEVLVRRESSFVESAGNQQYAALVAAESRMLAALSHEIAAAIKKTISKGQELSPKPENE